MWKNLRVLFFGTCTVIALQFPIPLAKASERTRGAEFSAAPFTERDVLELTMPTVTDQVSDKVYLMVIDRFPISELMSKQRDLADYEVVLSQMPAYQELKLYKARNSDEILVCLGDFTNRLAGATNLLSLSTTRLEMSTNSIRHTAATLLEQESLESSSKPKLAMHPLSEVVDVILLLKSLENNR